MAKIIGRRIQPSVQFHFRQESSSACSTRGYWQEHQNQPELNSWRGIAFDVAGDENEKGHQIDLIIDRADRVVNMCELKCYNDDFEVNAEYARTILRRVNSVMGHVSKRTSVQPTLIT